VETSVNELAKELMTAAGREVPTRYAAARPGELQHSCLDNGRIRGLGWSPEQTLRDGLAETYVWITAPAREVTA
jgi:UDP-glucose 4-epimerase